MYRLCESSNVKTNANAGFDASNCKECGCIEDSTGKNNNTLSSTV